MSSRPTQLDKLQQWMLQSITHSLGPSSGAGHSRINETILPSCGQTAVERLSVYHRAYFARLLEVLRELFPCTLFAIGEELFDEFAVGYLEAYPPTSYTLARLADRLVDYLDETRQPEWGQFVVELVRLEQAIDRVFDGPGPERDEAAAAQKPIPRLVPGFELQEFEYPVSTYFTDWKAGRQPTWPQPHGQFIVLFRRDYIVRRFEISTAHHQLLRTLADGLPLDEALEKLAERSDSGSIDALAADVRNWFELWSREGFFVK